MVWWDSSAGKQRSNQLANKRGDETSFPLFSKIFYQRISRQRQPKRKCLFSCIFVNNGVKGIRLKKICLSVSLQTRPKYQPYKEVPQMVSYFFISEAIWTWFWSQYPQKVANNSKVKWNKGSYWQYHFTRFYLIIIL